MSKRLFVVVWVLAFTLICIALSIKPPTSSHTWVYVLDTGVAYKAVDVQEREEHRRLSGGVDNTVAQAIYEPTTRRVPIEGVIEWGVEESLFHPGCYIFHYQTTTADQSERIYQALVDYAVADPSMAQFRPGEPPQTSFSWSLLGRSIVRLVLVTAVSLMFALFIRFVINMEIAIRKARKQHFGKCVHCAYEIEGLTSPICPECGKEHGSKIGEPA